MIIETHAHLSHFKFDNSYRYLTFDRPTATFSIAEGNREKLIEAMREADIGAVIEPAIDLASNEKLLQLADAHPGWIFPAVGVHPTRAPGEAWKDRRVLAALSKREGVVAIGETGLDFHYPRRQQHRWLQLKWFVYQIVLAHRRGLPLILHIRMADGVALAVLRLLRPLLHGGVAHCFYGDWRAAQALMKLGFHLGIGGTLLQDGQAGQTLAETVRRVPLERILLETDAPYVHPACDAITSGKMRGKVRNTPLILPAVIDRIAALKSIDRDLVERQTAENAAALFRLPPYQPKP